MVEKLNRYVDLTDAGALILLPAYGAMEPEVARANFELIARKVLPALKRRDVGPTLLLRQCRHSPEAAARPDGCGREQPGQIEAAEGEDAMIHMVPGAS